MRYIIRSLAGTADHGEVNFPAAVDELALPAKQPKEYR